MLPLLALWFVLLVCLVVFAVGNRHQGGALTLGYFVGLSLIHVPGVLVFLANGLGFANEQETVLGFQWTLLGMGVFVAGAVVAARSGSHRDATIVSSSRAQQVRFSHLGWRLIITGFLAYFVLVPISFAIPSLTSSVASLGTLLVIGMWIELYN